MNKYHELAKTHSDEIAEIKKLKTRYAAMVDQANDADDDDAEMLYQNAEKVYQDMVEKLVELQANVEAEYATVPFAKTRAAGVAGFYKAAGLD